MDSRSLIGVVRDYIERILSDQKAMKALLLDEETLSIVSLVITQTQILQRDVFLVERLARTLLTEDSTEADKSAHLHAVVLVRPTEENVNTIIRALQRPKFGHYALYFTNTISPELLQRIAHADSFEVVTQVTEVFADFYAVHHDCFSLHIPSTIRLLLPSQRWSDMESSTFERMLDGVFSVVLALRKMPVVRYQRSSPLCRMLADCLYVSRMQTKLRDDPDLMNYNLSRSPATHKTTIDGVDQTCTLVILDRRDDPVTPLLHQWTYQSMLHELLGLEHNRVHLKRSSEGNKEIALSFEDEFYSENLYSNLGDLAMNLQAFVEHYQ
jgi:vacuolar protein sorting-associated protein 45